jgi:hypothetical protein
MTQKAAIRDGKTRHPETAHVPDWEQEWREAAEIERAEPAFATPISHRALTWWLGLAVAAVLAALLPAILPLTPGYSAHDTAAQTVAAAIAATVALLVVPAASSLARRTAFTPRSARGAITLTAAALLSAGAAAIHFAVAKTHFEEYSLFGVFFVLSAIAQLVWAAFILFRPGRMVLLLSAVGNLAIAALWALDRIWGLPIGPEHWKPEPIGFADTTASGFEILVAVACLSLLKQRAADSTVGRLSGRNALALALPVIALTLLSLLSTLGIGSPIITPSA